MRNNIVSTMILCPGWRGEQCDRIVTIDYDVTTAKVLNAEGCPHIAHYSEPDLFDLAFDCFPQEELERRKVYRRGRHIKRQLPTAIEEEGIDDYDLGGEG